MQRKSAKQGLSPAACQGCEEAEAVALTAGLLDIACPARGSVGTNSQRCQRCSLQFQPWLDAYSSELSIWFVVSSAWAVNTKKLDNNGGKKKKSTKEKMLFSVHQLLPLTCQVQQRLQMKRSSRCSHSLVFASCCGSRWLRRRAANQYQPAESAVPRPRAAVWHHGQRGCRLSLEGG